MFRISSGRRALLGLAVATAMTASLTACGEESGDTTGPGAAVPSTAADAALAAKVPAAIKTAGKIIIGTDSTYAPNEFLDQDGKTVKGVDVDLFNAVAAKLGLTTEWQSSTFDAIIPGVTSAKYNIGVSSFTVNAERMKEATMVSYFSAGTQWAAKAGAAVNPDDMCGKKVAVQTGTVQVKDVEARSKKCTDAGKAKITIDQYQAQSDATVAVTSGKDDAMLADSPVGAYAVKQTNGQLVLVGDIYDSAPYGYVLPKDQAEFGGVIEKALEALIADGSYKTILTKWGVEAGAITDPAVNPQVF
ncbi:ABC transporter substrate-binding protein [Actinoplanes sp. NPDC051859]|uniref:ABC transporter substrate-binding protein n=1 Tax=Actinoplanes sp. NPDC051859 TaxID=3363909 RepID=UPI00378729EE